MGKNKGTVAEEYEFWSKVAEGGWKVPSNGRDGPAGSRFDRATKADASLKRDYDSIHGGPKVNERKAAFRSRWAQMEFEDVKARWISNLLLEPQGAATRMARRRRRVSGEGKQLGMRWRGDMRSCLLYTSPSPPDRSLS
eukprot:9466765-Pyramimonas_sp.AAC.1